MDDFNVEYCDPFDENNNYFMRVEHLGRYLFASNYINKNDIVLDIACANGYGTKILSKNCKKIIGIDRDSEYIRHAIENNELDNIEYIKKDIDEYDFSNKYNVIICFETIEHIKKPYRLLNQMYNALKDNGVLILSYPNSKYEKIENGKNKDKYHLHIFEKNEMESNINKYFEINKILGQTKINKIVNNQCNYEGTYDLKYDALTLGSPNDIEISDSYSFIYILKKKCEL